jgi:chromosomal replication initiation ATPase DnaA
MNADLRAWHSLGEGEGRVVLSLWRGLIDAAPVIPKDADIQKVVAAYYNIPLAEMSSDRRARKVARPRQVAMWLCKQLTTRSLPDIGQRFGGRDHTTVLHAIRRINDLRLEDPNIADDCDTLLETFRHARAA